MKVTSTAIPDVKLIEPKAFADDRGFFLESWHRDKFAAAGIDCSFAQDNHSRSKRGTLRGLHYQKHPGQAKLLRCVRGAIWDVAVDIRPGSPTFGRWVAEELSEQNQRMLFIPVGFAHGFVVLSEEADVMYKCSNVYVAETEAGIAWDDPDVRVAWPVKDPVLSQRDRTNPRLRELYPQAFGPR
ncbi:MAG: dTDP-4-dehydrorhamnose 3,5-epimerase [Planctomycetes bacterium]|nr:dTDP-4-dehydrorhamnose 3,5-epimerase [Planctomycetota bacterium]